MPGVCAQHLEQTGQQLRYGPFGLVLWDMVHDGQEQGPCPSLKAILGRRAVGLWHLLARSWDFSPALLPAALLWLWLTVAPSVPLPVLSLQPCGASPSPK